MSRFPAELILTLTDGTKVIECFNQAEMAQFTREKMLQALHNGESVVVYDGEPVEIAPQRVVSVQVVEQNLVTA